MVILGVRIEFYEKVGDVGEPSQNLLGAVYRDHGFRAAGVPGVGGTVLSDVPAGRAA
ncbi:hypothetical protein GCM10020256_01440 [Streptomyces thermocoprophilus]